MSWTHIEDKVVKARKPHRCYLCAESIPVGTMYRRRVGIDENGPVTTHMHPEYESETHNWDWTEWETFFEGDLQRPPVAGTPIVEPHG